MGATTEKPKIKAVKAKPVVRDVTSFAQLCVECGSQGEYNVPDITKVNIKQSEESDPIVVDGPFESANEETFDVISSDETVNAALVAIPTGEVWVQVLPQDEEYYQVSYTNSVG